MVDGAGWVREWSRSWAGASACDRCFGARIWFRTRWVKDDGVRGLAGGSDGWLLPHEASIEGGQHLNVNVMNKLMLLDAMEHPENIRELTVVSGYASTF
ncbi:hypothetical protein KCP73_02535 [Salmonella enterica subsp. enterica]|nr:hypothetical protein KCP73_02535 [Salmonella enterica subsp. enterica]